MLKIKKVKKLLFLFPLIASILWLLGFLFPAITIYYEGNRILFSYIDLPAWSNLRHYSINIFYLMLFLLISGLIVAIVIIIFTILTLVSSLQFVFGKKDLENARKKWKNYGLVILYLQIIVYVVIYGVFQIIHIFGSYLYYYTFNFRIAIGIGGNLFIIGGCLALVGYITSYGMELIEKKGLPIKMPSEQIVSKDISSELQPLEQNLPPLKPLVAKYCTNCGTKIQQDMKFCPNCGLAL